MFSEKFICAGYDYTTYTSHVPAPYFRKAFEIDGEVTKDFPVTSRLKKAKPVYVTMPGFKCDIRGIREFDKLPKEAQDYVLFIEKEIGVPIKLVSNGPRREEIIVR